MRPLDKRLLPLGWRQPASLSCSSWVTGTRKTRRESEDRRQRLTQTLDNPGKVQKMGRRVDRDILSSKWQVGSVHLHLPANPSAGLITVSKRTGAGPAASPSVVINLAKLLFSLGFSARGMGRGRGGCLRSAISINISTLRYLTTKGAATSTTDPFRRLGLWLISN